MVILETEAKSTLAKKMKLSPLFHSFLIAVFVTMFLTNLQLDTHVSTLHPLRNRSIVQKREIEEKGERR